MDGDTTKKKKSKKNVVVKKAISLETFVFLAIFFLIFGLMARKMGTQYFSLWQWRLSQVLLVRCYQNLVR